MDLSCSGAKDRDDESLSLSKVKKEARIQIKQAPFLISFSADFAAASPFRLLKREGGVAAATCDHFRRRPLSFKRGQGSTCRVVILISPIPESSGSGESRDDEDDALAAKGDKAPICFDLIVRSRV